MGHYPAIDILNSVSRLSSAVATGEQREEARRLREALAAYHQSEDLIQLGAYVSGSNPKLDAALRARPLLLDFLRQDAAAKSPLAETAARMRDLAAKLS
jgi:flagellar biosynthesis/type III secretory pathway ATPase